MDIPEKDLDFYATYSVIAVTGMVESWLTGQLDFPPDDVVDMIENIILATVEGVKLIYGKKNMK